MILPAAGSLHVSMWPLKPLLSDGLNSPHCRTVVLSDLLVNENKGLR
jgi:hypothetical protein